MNAMKGECRRALVASLFATAPEKFSINGIARAPLESGHDVEGK